MPTMSTAPFRLGRVDGDALRGVREREGLSQFVVALRSGLTVGTISRAENGRATRRSLQKICEVLRVAPDGLVLAASPPAPPLVQEAGR